MKTNEIIIKSSSILMERRREKNCWRIWKAYYQPFITHLQHYFAADVYPFVAEDDCCRILYVDISEKDFCMVSYLFAVLEISFDRIIAKGIFPEKYFPLWNEHITLHFCVEENGCERMASLRLDVKTGRKGVEC